MRRISALAISAALAFGTLLAGAAPAGAEDGLSYREFVGFEEVVANDVNAYWAETFAATGILYRDPFLVLTEAGLATPTTTCGISADPADVPASAPQDVKSAVSPAFYCPTEGGIFLASGWMYRDSYKAFGDFATAVVIAHEMAHHAQVVSGTTNPSVRQNELQADCWAGTWARAADRAGLLEAGDIEEAVNGLYAVGDYEVDDPDHHGTPKERYSWFLHGYKVADPGECNP